jgi:ATP-dependent DNA helicase DinG
VRVEKVDSPFDYANNALLFVPRGLPDTGDRTAAVNPVILELMEATGGRTLALFTSFAAMESAAAYCRQHSRIPVLLQNEAPASELAQRFADDEATSLFATRTFFQGVDIPGRTLSLVIIDKLPFPSPADPVLKARRAQIGPAAFQELDVVMCATDLAQAAGRLIRRTTDTGMVAVLDGRLLTKNYGPTLIDSLPPMHRTDDRGVALAFLREIAAG